MLSFNEKKELTLKYSSPGGRYTYTPSVSQWNFDEVSPVLAEEILRESAQSVKKKQGAVDVYLHIPFCQRLCTFCGCNIRVTSDPGEPHSYMETLIQEIRRVRSLFSQQSVPLNSLYIGGGTPNFLPAEELERLLETLFSAFPPNEDFTGTMEADPNLELEKLLPLLERSKIQRLSFGIQDTHEKILANVNRHQSLDRIREVFSTLSQSRFETNLDLIYGLPYQTPKSIERTMQEVVNLGPDQVAFYPLALVPWQQKTQKAFGDFSPPSHREKVELALIGQEVLEKSDYQLLGFDHYARKGSTLERAFESGTLARTPMGYTPNRSNCLLSFGVSSIGYSKDWLWQNEKILEKYLHQTQRQEVLPLSRAHHKTPWEKEKASVFEALSTQSLIQLQKTPLYFAQRETVEKRLRPLIQDGLIHYNPKTTEIAIPPIGRSFLKSLCEAFDFWIDTKKG